MGQMLVAKFYSFDGGQTRLVAADDLSSGKVLVADPATAEYSVAFEGSYQAAVGQLATMMQSATIPAPAPVMAAPVHVEAPAIEIDEMIGEISEA